MSDFVGSMSGFETVNKFRFLYQKPVPFSKEMHKWKVLFLQTSLFDAVDVGIDSVMATHYYLKKNKTTEIL